MQRLRGVASVSDTGEANWHLQLTVPPGRAGWEPNLTLSYSSGRGSSVYGVGFDLSVGSRIHRCGQDIDLDGDTTAVRFTDDDRLCLNGVRLVATDATSSYWSSSAEYRVESRAVDRIRRANPSTGYVFEITHRDGSRTYYGGKNAATASVRHGDRNPDGTMQAGPHGELEWLIAREEDRSGNQIDYEYDLDESSDGSFEHLLDRIRYTGHATRAPTREIVFEYEARSASENFFTAGAHRLLSQRVKEIRMNVSGSLVRRYPLEYELSAGGRDVLKEITECDRFATCRPPTTFDWSDQTVSSAGGSWSSFDLPKGWDFGEAWESMLEVGDFNGDGLDDIVYHERTNGGSNRRIFMRFGWVTTTPEPGVVLSHPVSTFTPPIDTGLSRDVQREAGFPNLRWFTVVDHDEDGTDELIVQQVSASTPDAWSWDLYDVLPSGPSPADGATVHLLDEAYLDCTTWIDWVIPGPIVGDFNGDGGADAFGTCLSESGVLDHRAASFDWMAQRASAFPVSNQALGDDPLWTQRVVADLNGDGKQEVLTWPAGYDPNGLGILDHLGGAPSPDPTLTSLLTIGTPAGEMPAIHLPLQDFTHPSGEDIEISYVFLDINGDGLQDALTLDTTGGPTLRLNTGRGFGPPQSPFDPSLPTLDYLLLSATSAVQVADFNHDGRDDMLVPFHRGAGAATPPAVRLHLSRGETFEVLDLAAPGERTDLPAIPASAPPQQLRFALSQVRLMDRNGDGVREFSQIRNGRLEFDTINAGPGDRLIAVHDGGTFPHFVYGFDTAEVPTDPLHAYPRAAMAPQRVVVTLKHTLGDSGDHFVDHWFRDGLVDVRRRNSLGYGTHSFRNDDDLITRYQFDRTLADVGNRLDLTVNAGLPARRLYEDWSSGSCDEGRDVRYTYQTQTDDSATDAYRVLTEVEEDRSYDCSFGTSETDLVPFFQHRTDRAFDSWGTLKEETITDLLGADRTVATYVLENLIGPFQIGLIRERYITSIVEGDVASRTTFFDYHPDGRLKTETAEPGGGPELRVEFHHDYDAFGNEERFEIKAGSESRVTETVYAGDSIYPSLVRNALGHEIELLFDDGLGALLDEEAVNPHGPNRHQWARYDGFGQPVQMHRQGVDDLVEYEAVGDHILVHVNAASGRSTTGEVNGRGQLVRAVRRHGSGASSYYQQVFE
ncbi:MAG: FG-GAP-like repeat-containing protein [Myxococcota bacterium]